MEETGLGVQDLRGLLNDKKRMVVPCSSFSVEMVLEMRCPASPFQFLKRTGRLSECSLPGLGHTVTFRACSYERHSSERSYEYTEDKEMKNLFNDSFLGAKR